MVEHTAWITLPLVIHCTVEFHVVPWRQIIATVTQTLHRADYTFFQFLGQKLDDTL